MDDLISECRLTPEQEKRVRQAVSELVPQGYLYVEFASTDGEDLYGQFLKIEEA